MELFRFLRDENIEVDLLVGCSGGAILAALHGIGCSPEEITANIQRFWNRRLFERLDWRTILGILRLPLGRFSPDRAILDPAVIKRTLHSVFLGKRIEDLKPKTVIQTTDITTGEGVVLSEGLLAQALYASGAQFPFLPPETIGGKKLVDGGFSAALPIMEAVKRQVDVIIALTPEVQSEINTGFIDYCLHFFSRSFRISERSQTTLAVDLHHHEIIIIDVPFDQVINMWNVEKIPVILEAGRKAVQKHRQEILTAISSFGHS